VTRSSDPEISRPPGIPENAILRVLRAPPEAAGMRLDVFVQRELRNTSRTRAKSIVERSAFSSDGRKLSAHDRVHAEDRIVLWRLPFEEIDAIRTIPVVYEDKHLLVVEKPPLVAVHPTARHHHATVIKILRAERPDEFLSLVHRLDRETSGLLLVGRSPEADRAFKRLLEDRSIEEATGKPRGRKRAPPVEKTYLALTWGVPPTGLVDLPLEIDSENSLRVKMRIAKHGGLEARTEVEVLEQRGGYALVRCRLLTGRQHQIRIHLAAQGTPIVGDKLYGPDERLLARAADRELTPEDLERLELPRHALHAHRYAMTHAVTGEALVVESALSADLAEFWDSKQG
jgi:23S rRNA pseudouridine1911/1915/1917 synthase